MSILKARLFNLTLNDCKDFNGDDVGDSFDANFWEVDGIWMTAPDADQTLVTNIFRLNNLKA